MINSFKDAIAGYFRRHFYLFFPLQMSAHMHFPGSQLPELDISRSIFLKSYIGEILEGFRFFCPVNMRNLLNRPGKDPSKYNFFSRVEESV